MAKEIPKSSKVVVIGGGVIGCSVAYHLTKFGWKDVVLLERDQLVSESDGIEIERFRVAQTMSDETDKNYIIRRVTHKPRLEIRYRTKKQFDRPSG